jgi:ATP-dependent DNA helicase RecQ
VIFQDPSLEDMALQYPVTLDEMQNIVGVGTGKAKRYGKEFVELIKSYVEEKRLSGLRIWLLSRLSINRESKFL